MIQLKCIILSLRRWWQGKSFRLAQVIAWFTEILNLLRFLLLPQFCSLTFKEILTKVSHFLVVIIKQNKKQITTITLACVMWLSDGSLRAPLDISLEFQATECLWVPWVFVSCSPIFWGAESKCQGIGLEETCLFPLQFISYSLPLGQPLRFTHVW